MTVYVSSVIKTLLCTCGDSAQGTLFCERMYAQKVRSSDLNISIGAFEEDPKIPRLYRVEETMER